MRLYMGLEETLKENMSMKSAYTSFYIAIALLVLAIALHVVMVPKQVAKETHEDVQLLAPDFNAETLGSVVVRNAHGVTANPTYPVPVVYTEKRCAQVIRRIKEMAH